MKKASIVILGNNRLDLELLSAYVSEVFEQYEDTEVTVSSLVDPKRALEYVAQNGCDILFSEAELCGTDGLNLLRKIRKAYPQISIVITTTYEEYIVQAVQMQIKPAGYLSLPTTVSKIKDLIESILMLPQSAKAV